MGAAASARVCCYLLACDFVFPSSRANLSTEKFRAGQFFSSYSAYIIWTVLRVVSGQVIMDSVEACVQSLATSTVETEQEYCLQLCASATDFRKSGEFCDLNLKVGSSQYLVHKMVVAAFSPVLKATLRSDSSVISYDGGQSVLSICDLDENIVEAILDYAYQGKINITKQNVNAIFHAAHTLQVKSLLDTCCRLLLEYVNVENCLGLWSLAEAYACDVLQEKARRFCLENFEQVCCECEFLELEPEKVIEILREDALKVTEEYVVFNAVLQWMHYKKERIEGFDKVLRQVRLAHVDGLALNDRFLQDEVLRKSENCRRLLEEANNYNLLTNRMLERHSSITRRRIDSPLVEAVEVSYKAQNEEHLVDRRFCITEDGSVLKCRESPPTSDADSLLPCVKCCNYKVMAHSDDFSVHWFWRDLDQNFKLETSPILVICQDCAFGELDGVWYSFGGSCEGQMYTRTVECYDCSKDMWTYCASMLKAVHHPAVVSLEGMIYILGGYDGREWSRDLQLFSPRRQEWKQCSPLPGDFQQPQACGLNRRIYVCAVNALNKMYVYDVATDEWSLFAELRHQYVAGPVLLNGRIFVLVKKDCGEVQLERYLPESETWQEFATFSGISPYMISGPYLFTHDRKADTSNADKVTVISHKW